MQSFLMYLGIAVAILLLLLYSHIRVPNSLPRNLPNIPIYVSIMGLWSDMGQDEIFERWLRQPLKKHGAVKVWFAGRWNILATRPDLVSQIFRNEDLYAKAGSQKKIPWGVIAKLVGDNIINSHGDTWKHYTSIMKPGMQKTHFDSKPLLEKSRRFVDLMVDAQGKAGPGGVLVNPIIQRFAIAAMGEAFLDIDFGTLDRPGVRIEELQTIIKRTLFKPLYFNFPNLDKYPYIFRSRLRAFGIMQEFEDLLFNAVRNNPRKLERKKRGETVAPQDELVIHMMERAFDNGEITELQFRDNIKITFLTAHENTQQLLNSAFWKLGTDTSIQEKLRKEVLETGLVDPNGEQLNKMGYLTAVVAELLRLYPPVSQLINRVSLAPSQLGDAGHLPKGTWVGWNAYGVQTEEQVWGPTAKEFIAERWGTRADEVMTKMRKETVKGNFIAFNSHNRKCLGQGYAQLEMKMALFELVRRVKWTVAPDYKVKWTSGGIMAPLGCRVVFEELSAKELNGHAVSAISEKPSGQMNGHANSSLLDQPVSEPNGHALSAPSEKPTEGMSVHAIPALS